MYGFSFFLAVYTILLILAGGLVTSHGAGLAVPDWPLSYGKFFPPMVGNVFWEHGHRMIAGSVGILTLILAVWIQWKDGRAWVRRLGWAAFGAVALQALLGGLTVLLMLPAPVSIFHACLAQTFFCILIAITYFLSPDFKKREIIPLPLSFSPPGRQAGDQGGARLAATTVVFIYLQLILGATVRHSGHAVIVHVVFALAVVVHVLRLAARILYSGSQDETLVRTAGAMGILVLVQIFLGIGSFVFTRMLEQGYSPSVARVVFTAAHQTTGALILGSAFLITLKVWRK